MVDHKHPEEGFELKDSFWDRDKTPSDWKVILAGGVTASMVILAISVLFNGWSWC